MKKLFWITVILASTFFFIYICLAFLFGGFGNQPRSDLAENRGHSMLLFAHRGILNYFPEHSIAGADHALRVGFNAIEMDIRESSDDTLIVFHDETAERLLGINSRIDALELSKIKEKALIFGNERTSNYVLTVDEFVDRYKNDFIIYCDLKLFRFSDADQIVEIIKKNSAARKCIVASADIFLILYIEMKNHEIITALEGFDAGKEWTYRLIPKKLRPDYLSGFLHNINAEHLVWLRKMNLMPTRIAYGVNSSNYELAKKQGIKNIILDYDSTLGNLRKDITPINANQWLDAYLYQTRDQH